MTEQNSAQPWALDFLATSAEGLDLTVAYDRALFRTRVAERLKATKVEAMREWLPGVPMPGRFSATRAIADAYIAKATTPQTGD